MKGIIITFLLSFGLCLSFSEHVYAARKGNFICAKFMARPIKAKAFDVFNEAILKKLINDSNQTLAHLRKVETDHLERNQIVKAVSLSLAFKTLEYAQKTKSSDAIPSYIYVFENIEALYNDLIRVANRHRPQMGDFSTWTSLTTDGKVKRISDHLVNGSFSGLSQKISPMYEHVQEIREARGFMSPQSVDVFTRGLVKRILLDFQRNQASVEFKTLILDGSTFKTRSAVDSASKDVLRVAKILDIPLSSSISVSPGVELDILYALDFYKRFSRFSDLNSVKRYIIKLASEVQEIVSVHLLD